VTKWLADFLDHRALPRSATAAIPPMRPDDLWKWDTGAWSIPDERSIVGRRSEFGTWTIGDVSDPEISVHQLYFRSLLSKTRSLPEILFGLAVSVEAEMKQIGAWYHRG
jgi:hypothetical protein